ncbi:MAG: RdgB/HAM1 family non-canonical purine NTP pyrophosphatase [Oscillospiraceae bacterium]|jgi:XTP/dITP diphosphohydrolase|nr:RdgB/HAM1 family non-canonical purine NTP pyrophosphatase [Oscillospiraceae bacterium]
MKFVIATNNQKKLAELSRILQPLGVEAYTAAQLGFALEDVEETGSTFAENAFLKADAACRLTGLPAIADDSGLCVDALNGEPGVFSARYAGEGATDDEKIALLLKNLQDVPPQNRTAHFACAVACVFPNGEVITAFGQCNGNIAFAKTGNGGFGYDPVFMLGENSFAQLSAEEKDKLSHRGNALRQFKAKLQDYLDKT